MSMRRADPLRMLTVRDAIERLFGEGLFGRSLFPGRLGGLGEEQWVPVNMFELPEGLMVIAPMPGLQANDVELTVAGNILTLRGRRTPGQEDRDYLVKEWDYGPYGRTIELPFPVDADHIIATLDNGVLTVNLRKAEAVIPKRIHVRTADQSSVTGGETHHSPQGLAREKAGQ
ncbi:MAG: Hsp20/alpha crystallin family protein [Sphingomonadaceae bacterium]